MATVKVAGTVLAEDPSTLGSIQAQKRLGLAQVVLRDPDAQLPAFIYPVVSNPAIAAAGLDAPDGDLEFQVTQVWDAVAGVTTADKTTTTDPPE
jgi:hypothetical protein